MHSQAPSPGATVEERVLQGPLTWLERREARASRPPHLARTSRSACFHPFHQPRRRSTRWAGGGLLPASGRRTAGDAALTSRAGAPARRRSPRCKQRAARPLPHTQLDQACLNRSQLQHRGGRQQATTHGWVCLGPHPAVRWRSRLGRPGASSAAGLLTTEHHPPFHTFHTSELPCERTFMSRTASVSHSEAGTDYHSGLRPDL